MFLLTAIKKEFSSKEIQFQLGLKGYEPVWAKVHKLCKAMGNRDDKYTLEGMVKMAEGILLSKLLKMTTKHKKLDETSKTKSNAKAMA